MSGEVVIDGRSTVKIEIGQSNKYSATDFAAIEHMLGGIHDQSPDLERSIGWEQLDDLIKSLNGVRAQLESSKPDSSIIRSGRRSGEKKVLEGAGGAIVASGWLNLWQRLV